MFDVTVEKLVYGGEGLARVDGQVVLAPFVLPGERVRLEARGRQSGVLRARPVEVLAPAAHRVSAPCPYFGRCGGCHYQHADYAAQLQVKCGILCETFARVGKLPVPRIEVEAAEPWGYRNRARFHISGFEIGYLEAQSHRLCPVDHCPISSPAVNQALAAIRGMLRDRRWPRFMRSLELFTNESALQLNALETHRPLAHRFFDWCAERIPSLVPGALDYQAAGFTFRVGRGSFFQANRFLMDRMVSSALEGATGETALDLYAGVGLFSLPLARRFHSVTAVESGGSAARDLRFNAERGGVSVSVAHAGAAEFLARTDLRPDFVLADPPRAGLGKEVVRRLLELRPARMTIVSCDPATLARDLAGLIAGGYQLERTTLIDLFPQTFHIETVASLTRLPKERSGWAIAPAASSGLPP